MEGPKILNLKYLILFLSIVSSVNCANILGIFGSASHSHFVWNNVLVQALAARGHNLTLVAGDISNKQEKNIHYIHLEKMYSNLFIHENDNPHELNSFLSDYIGAGTFRTISLSGGYFDLVCEGIANSEGLQTVLNYPDNFKFDVALYDYTMGPCLLGLLHKFNYPPMVGITAFNRPPFTVDLVGGNIHPSYIPLFSNRYDVNMTLWEKILNTAGYYGDFMWRDYVHIPRAYEIMKGVFGQNLPHLGDLEKRALLVLTNSHPAVNYPEPLTPNVIEVGGLQISEPKPLRTDLENFINASSKGAVLFSLGTNIKSVFLGKRICSIFLKAFEGLPEYNFLWKLESDNLFNELPKNVMIGPWMPQTDILAHPKIKAFITHNGGLSTQEAIWFGVPMIGIPIFIDQPRNAHRMKILGTAEYIDIQTITVDSFRNTIRKVLETPSYAENAKTISELFRDRPMKPLETAVWWIEYAIRHPNTTHMRSPHLDNFAWKGHYFDITSFVCLCLSSIAILSYMVLTKICCRRNSDKIKNTSKHNKYE